MNESAASKTVRPLPCAIYTRKSTTEGLEQEFNSLDAQREAAEAYIASQRHEGWECLPDRYDDGGYTGGNTDRPALRQLEADIAAGKVRVVVVYKVDRLSRSLRDFLTLMELFLRHGVMFVSVTQAFNTATSMGRLMLNVLLSFAQFEREMVSERTRDKMAAARRKGMWVGGRPVLGYDIEGTKLVINEIEAERVRAIFQLYLQLGGLIPLVQELANRGWTNKLWKGRGGQLFTKGSLHRLLTNVTYIGKVLYQKETFEGQHQPLIDSDTWQRTQAQLSKNARSGGTMARNQFGALLKGLLHCAACGCAMTPTHSTKGGNTRYRYYRCVNSQQRGHRACPCPTVPAHEIEKVVVNQIRAIGSDPDVVAETLIQVRSQVSSQIVALESEERVLDRELAEFNAKLRKLLKVAVLDADSAAATCLAELQDGIQHRERRLANLQQELVMLQQAIPEQRTAAQALAEFTPVWNALTPREQVQLVELLVQRVDFDGVGGNVSITFHPHGLEALAAPHEEHAA